MTRRPEVRSRISRPRDYPMDLVNGPDPSPQCAEPVQVAGGSTRWTWGPSWTVAPTCDGGGAGPIKIARLPSRLGGAICDSGATVAFMTTTANVDDQTSLPQAQFLRPSSCKGDTPKFSIRIPSVPLCLLAQQQSEASEQTDAQQ